ncbi:hypothetical protein LPB86_20150 [Pedobacter sp. MC2016-14]|uniref:hypothetical protein n=1 Tax=Pedobacter sp. MC2016-14 TaxID=2897327 RepID=UPI001E617E30|nr:hypothetical protein [Pedobacter sp. MC2016-14]MCD0490563.1 hypothetical protein [Pedobacter sp. MC2016-14]
MNKRLQLNIYLKGRNRACLVFKRNPFLYRINNLMYALQFVANMEQLSLMIASGARQNCSFVLIDSRGKKWILYFEFEAELISLKLNTGFVWSGGPVEFRQAVANLTKMTG